MTEQAKPPIKRAGPPTLGLAIAADFWLWGALILYAPSYLGIASGWQVPFYIFGFLSLTLSLAAALMELSKLWKSEGLSYWGVSLVFLLPAVLLHLAAIYLSPSAVLVLIAKIAALILAAIGGALFIQGIPFFFWKDSEIQQTSPKPTTSQEIQAENLTKLKTNLEVIASIIIAFLSLATV